jgi:hypothetical protein
MSEDFEYANELLKALANNYDIEYVEISDLFQITLIYQSFRYSSFKREISKNIRKGLAKINSILF